MNNQHLTSIVIRQLSTVIRTTSRTSHISIKLSVVESKPQKIYLYWANTQDCFEELQNQLGEFRLSSYMRLQVLKKIQSSALGLLRWRKDFKPLVAYQSEGLWELRFSFIQDDQEIKLRLICASLNTENSVALCWHVKQNSLSPTEQRHFQNLDCERAIKRKKRLRID